MDTGERYAGRTTLPQDRSYGTSLAAALVAALMLAAPLMRAGPAGSSISDGVVRIAVLGDYGSGRDLGGPGSVTAAKLAAEGFHNQVLGKPIEIVSAGHP